MTMACSNSQSKESVWLRLIQINDVYELDNFASFKTLCDAHSEGPDQVLIVLSGDFLAPSLLSALDFGRGMVDVLNHCGVTHVCLGNHETDIPPPHFVQRIQQSKFIWLNTNMRELDEKLSTRTEPYDVVTVQHKYNNNNATISKKVALLGLLTDDPSLYRPGSFGGAKIEPILQCTESCLEQLPQDTDLIIPLTHQIISHDRTFCHKFGNLFPVVVGGHDHEPYDEVHNHSRIIKTGYNAQNTAIIDLKWHITENSGTITTDPHPIVEIQLIPTATYQPDAPIQQRVDCHQRVLLELERAKLFRFEDWLPDDNAVFSTSNNRLGGSTGSSVLTTILRMGMRATCAVFNAGNIRGNRIYDHKEQEWFTWSDLKTEIPYSCPITAIEVPGKILEATIRHSRRRFREDPPVAFGGYIHHCDNIEFSNITFTISSIAGEPFDPDRLYLTAVPVPWFAGIDNHAPILEWAESENLHIDDEHGRPAKIVVVELFSALLWLDMGSFADMDKDRDGVLIREDVEAKAIEIYGENVGELVVESLMDIADLNRNGTISPKEMMVVKFVATDMMTHVSTTEELRVLSEVASEVLGKHPSQEEIKDVVKELMTILDLGGDGRIQRIEVMEALGEIKRKSLLV